MAARSIIDIEINDEKFKAFKELFEEFRAKLGNMGGEFAPMEEGAEKVGATFADMTAAMMAQAELMHRMTQEQARQDRSEREAERGKRDAEKAQKKASDDRAKASKKQVEDIKAIGKGVAGITVGLIKWASLGGVFTGLLGAGGLFGLDRLADSVGGARRAAQGLGVTSGQQRAFGVNFSRYVDPNSNLENIANAKSDLSKRWAFAAMGINPDGHDPADLAVSMMDRARSLFRRTGQSSQAAEAMGLTQFYSMDELRRLANSSPEELAKSRAGYASDARSLALDDATQKQWQDFSIQMHRAGMQIESVFVRGLTPLVPQLTKLSNSVSKALGDFLANPHMKEWLNDFASGIEATAKYLGSSQFQSDMRDFVEDISAVAKALANALRWLNLIPDHSVGGGGAGNSVPTPLSHGGGSMAGAAARYALNPTGFKANQYGAMGSAVGHLMAGGMSEGQAAGVVANLFAESGLNPNAVGDKGKALGIGQWHPDRQAAFRKWAGFAVTDPRATLEKQLDFVMYEMANGEAAAGGKIRGTGDNAFAAGVATSHYYERPFDPLGTNSLSRGASAQFLRYGLDKETFGDVRSIAAGLKRAQGTKTKTLAALIAAYEPKGDIGADIKAVAGDTGIKGGDVVNIGDANTLGRITAALERRKTPAANLSSKAVITIINNTGGSAVVSTNQLAK